MKAAVVRPFDQPLVLEDVPISAMIGPERAADGAPPASIRPVEIGDLEGLDALLSALDTQSRYRRWFTGTANVHRAAAWAAHPESQRAVGLVAADSRGRLIGHAAFVSIDDARAEICFEVDAAWRHHGIAGRLLSELDRQAARRGLTTLVAEVLAENHEMLAVLREHAPCREHRDGAVIEVELTVGSGQGVPEETTR